MRLCVVTFKRCWQDERGRWMSYGGFPAQMAAVGGLFDKVTLVVVRGAPQGKGMPLPEHAEVVGLRSPVGKDFRRKISVLAHLFYYLSSIVRQVRRADVVHTPVPGDIAFLGMIVALVQRKRLIGLYNGSWLPNSETTIMNRVTRACMRVFAGGRNVMLAVGDGEPPPAPRMQWIFATALSDMEVRQSRADLNRGLSTHVKLVYAGRLSVEKGVPNLVRVISRLRDDGFQPLPQCTLIGDGPQRVEIEALVRELGCGDSITFMGQLERPELTEQLRQADVCVHPSLTEGFCKAWLDAMAQGLPVLTTQVGAASAVVGFDGLRGWLVPPADIGAFAAKLRMILTSPLDWAALRGRCRVYSEVRTLEAWGVCIRQACVRQWGLSLVDGKLVE